MKPLVLTTLTLAFAAPDAARAAADWNRGTLIAITVTNDRFIPDRVQLRRGGQYVLRFRNASNRKHNFSAPTFFKYARVAPRDAGWITDNALTLAPGQGATLHIFAPTTPNASYEFRSTRIEDAAEKMKGRILVQ